MAVRSQACVRWLWCTTYNVLQSGRSLARWGRVGEAWDGEKWMLVREKRETRDPRSTMSVPCTVLMAYENGGLV